MNTKEYIRKVTVGQDEAGIVITVENWVSSRSWPVVWGTFYAGTETGKDLAERVAKEAKVMQDEGIAEIAPYVGTRGWGTTMGFVVLVFEDADPRTFTSGDYTCPVCGHDLEKSIAKLITYGSLEQDDCPTCESPLSVDLGPMPATVTVNFMTVEEASAAIEQNRK